MASPVRTRDRSARSAGRITSRASAMAQHPRPSVRVVPLFNHFAPVHAAGIPNNTAPYLPAVPSSGRRCRGVRRGGLSGQPEPAQHHCPPNSGRERWYPARSFLPRPFRGDTFHVLRHHRRAIMLECAEQSIAWLRRLRSIRNHRTGTGLGDAHTEPANCMALRVLEHTLPL